uniref:RdRp n=1 Tax=Wuhan pillworm virus 4 TaxID=1923747 RepID=A0A1L3KLQ7_9VIRU|nr:RdRp [Wuhan pillworm virus 4]
MLSDEIVKEFTKMSGMTKLLKPLKPSGQEKVLGVSLSKLVNKDPLYLPITPYLKNALIKFGDLNDSVDSILLDSKITKAETYMMEESMKMASKLNGPENVKYDSNLDPTDYSNYNVDVWSNMHKMGSEVTPGANKRSLENFQAYLKSLMGADFVYLIKHDKTFYEVISFIMDLMPNVSSSDDIVEVNLPFQTKHTNVGYPYYSNDSTNVKGSNPSITYGDLTLEEAKSLDIKLAITYPGVLLGRDQRSGWLQVKGKILFLPSKASDVIATSSETNLILNKLESQEMMLYKTKSPLFMGYNSHVVLKSQAELDYKILQKSIFSDYSFENFDYSSFDTTVTMNDNILLGALSTLKTVDHEGKDIARNSAAWMTKMGVLLPNGNFKEVLGPIKSGAIDTNRGGGLINAMNSVWAATLADKNWMKIASIFLSYGGCPIKVMGDDLQIISNNSVDFQTLFPKYLKQNSFKDVNPDKGEYGFFFLQKSYYKYGGGFIYSTPWPSVLSKIFWVESPKGLGVFGWTMATYMKLDDISENKEAFSAIVNFVAKFDNYKLGTYYDGKDLTFDQFSSLLVEESKTAEAQGKLTVRFIVDDGDPNKTDVFEGDNISDDWLKRMWYSVKQSLMVED